MHVCYAQRMWKTAQQYSRKSSSVINTTSTVQDLDAQAVVQLALHLIKRSLVSRDLPPGFSFLNIQNNHSLLSIINIYYMEPVYILSMGDF